MSFARKALSRIVLASAALCVMASGLPARAGTPNATGINVDYLNDSANTPMLTDVMRTYRHVNTIGSAYNANNAPLDADGWATSDAWYFLGDPAFLKHADGTYAIKFNGQATIGLGQYNDQGSVVNQTYDAATNTTTANIVMRSGVDLTDLRFTNTQRNLASGANTGVTNVQLMRPTTPGGNTPYAFDTTFTDQTKTIAQKVGVLRFMDFLGTNANPQVSWSDRTKPTTTKLVRPITGNSRGYGGPLELAVQLGNEANRDIWVNVPTLANDDYVKNLANLIKYGSDGTNPYTSPQANPVYKPLNPNLHVYVEYSNETWNSQFEQYKQVEALGKAALANETIGAGPLSFTSGYNTQVYLGQRYTALRTKQIADIFAGVYGEGALLNTVRPILSWQGNNGQDSANQMQLVLDGYFNNAKGNFVANPTPMNKYIYGGGSTYYYAPTTGLTNLTVDNIVTEPLNQTAARVAGLAKDAAYATTFGLKRVAYEGGLALDSGGAADTPASLAVKMAALADPRMTQMVVQNHNQWTGEGGDLLVYYFSTDQYKFAHSDEYFSTDTPKLNGLAQLSGSDRTTEYTIGTPLTRAAASVISGGQFTLRDVAAGAYTGAVGLDHNHWTSYLINVAQAGDYQLVARYRTYGGAASLKLILGGATLADFAALVSEGKYTGTAPLTLTLPQGITSIRVLLNTNSAGISLENLTFTPVGTVSIPEPAALGLMAAGGLVLRRRRKVI